MNFPIVDQAIASAKKALPLSGAISADDLSLRDLLTRGAIILAVSEFEVAIEHLFISRIAKAGDAQVVSLANKSLLRVFRSPDLSKITEILGRFSDHLKASFTSKVTNTAMHASWDSLLRARHAIVHKQGVLQLTFEDFEKSYVLCLSLIDELADVLK